MTVALEEYDDASLIELAGRYYQRAVGRSLALRWSNNGSAVRRDDAGVRVRLADDDDKVIAFVSARPGSGDRVAFAFCAPRLS